MCEILMLIFGIITVIRGRFSLTRAKEVRGWPARAIGVILILPMPASFSIGLLLGVVFTALGKNIDDRDFVTAAMVGEFGIVALCFFSAIGVAMFLAEPIRKKRSEPEDTAIPADYEERFPARDWNIKNEGIKDRPSRPPSAPDDRIQS